MSSNGPRFKVEISKLLAARVRQLYDTARARNEGQQFIDSLRTIYERMQANPLEFGEPLYRLPTLQLIVCIQVLYPISVDYAVHEELTLVWFRDIHLM